jgi:hypothetical protein
MKYFLFALAFIVVAGCQSGENSEMSEASEMDHDAMGHEWISLFDGTSMAQWRGYAQEDMPAGWVITDGTMFASAPGSGMDIVTRDTYTNFELELEWKVAAGGNSGIMWHVDESAGDTPWKTGPEYQLLDDAAFNEGVIGKNSAGSNYDVQAPSESVNKPAGEWNKTRIVVDGNWVEHWLNDVKVVEYEKGSEAHKAAVATSKWVNYPTYGTTSTGHIAFQGDHGEVWFKDIRIRRIDKPASE